MHQRGSAKNEQYQFRVGGMSPQQFGSIEALAFDQYVDIKPCDMNLPFPLLDELTSTWRNENRIEHGSLKNSWRRPQLVAALFAAHDCQLLLAAVWQKCRPRIDLGGNMDERRWRRFDESNRWKSEMLVD